MGIRGRLLVLTMGVAVPLAIFGLLGLDWLWNASREKLDTAIRKQAELTAAAFDGWIDAERQPLIALAASGSGRPRTQSFTDEELHAVLRAHPSWLAVQAIDEGGRVVAAWPIDANPLPPETESALRADLAAGSPSAMKFDWGIRPGKPTLVVAAPLADGGWLNARVDATFASQALKGIELPSGSVILLFDPAHKIVQRSPGGEAFVGVDRSDSPSFARLAESRSIVAERESRSDGVVRVYGMARVGTTGCAAGVGVPSSELYESSLGQFKLYLLFSIVALASAIVASLLIARTIAIPVRHLGDVAKRLGTGDFTVRAGDLGGGEIAELGRVFNSMARSLGDRDAKLAELDRLKSEFVSSVSHELRTPLTTIKTLTQVLQRGGETADERDRYLDAIEAECDRQIDFVLDLLDLSRIEAGAFTLDLECVDVTEVVEASVVTEGFSAEASGHELVADLPADLPYVRADRVALRRVLRCLIENAVRYTPRGGRITISAREAEASVVLTVTDTGRGIAADDLPRLFERFFRSADGVIADPRGVGLGLHLAHTIVEHLGGTLSVESEVGRGSAFSVRLQRWAASAAPCEIIEEKVDA